MRQGLLNLPFNSAAGDLEAWHLDFRWHAYVDYLETMLTLKCA